MGKRRGIECNETHEKYMQLNNVNRIRTPEDKDFEGNSIMISPRFKIACLVGDRLLDGLQYECDLMPVTPSRAEKIFKYWKPKCLLVDSARIDREMEFNSFQIQEVEKSEELQLILQHCRHNRIPTVYWITQSEHLIKPWIRLFDIIYCADPKDISRLHSMGIEATELLPCTQPKIYRNHEQIEKKEIDILIEIPPNLSEYESLCSRMEEFHPMKVKFIESTDLVNNKNIELNAQLELKNLGRVQPLFRDDLLEKVSAYITHSSSSADNVKQTWDTLDAIAAGAMVVHHGKIEDNDVRKRAVIECASYEELFLEFYRQKGDQLYVDDVAYAGWSRICSSHTYTNRLQQIIIDLCKKNTSNQVKKASEKCDSQQMLFTNKMELNPVNENEINITVDSVPPYNEELKVWKDFIGVREIIFRADRKNNKFSRGWKL